LSSRAFEYVKALLKHVDEIETEVVTHRPLEHPLSNEENRLKKGFEKGVGETNPHRINAHIYMLSPITLQKLMKKARQKGEEMCLSMYVCLCVCVYVCVRVCVCLCSCVCLGEKKEEICDIKVA